MDIKPALAAQGYVNARPVTAPTDARNPAADFTELAENFVEILARGEQTAKAAMTGDASPHALVQALAATELAVETAVTLRDKVVEAYQEILRMPV